MFVDLLFLRDNPLNWVSHVIILTLSYGTVLAMIWRYFKLPLSSKASTPYSITLISSIAFSLSLFKVEVSLS